MKPIVVGVDGSATSLLAAQWGAGLAAAAGAELHAVASLMPSESELPPARMQKLRDELASQLRGWVDPIADRHGVTYVAEVADGDPRSALNESASRHDADALVIGAVGRTGASPGWLRLGSVAEYLAHNSSVPLVVMPPSGSATVERIVVGIDGSRHAATASSWCARLAAATGATVEAVAVARQLVGGWEVIPERTIREKWIGDLAKADVDLTCRVVQDPDAANGILQAAHDAGADLVVVGMRGLGGFLGLRAGGVAMKVLHRSDITVALIPPE